MNRTIKRALLALAVVVTSLGLTKAARATPLLVANHFFNSVDLYDSQTLQLIQSSYITIAPPTDPYLGIVGVAVDPVRNRVYVSAREANTVYVYDSKTRLPIGSGVFATIAGQAPAGLTLDASGNLYVALNGGASVNKYKPDGSLDTAITSASPLLAAATGVSFASNGTLLISNFAGTNLLRYDANAAPGSQVTQIASPGAFGPFGPFGVVEGLDGSFYVADVFSNGVFKYNSLGVEIPGPTPGSPFFTVVLPNYPPFAVFPNSPSGLLLDPSGDILISILGPTNPRSGLTQDQFESHGALLRIDSAGNLLASNFGPSPSVGLPPAAGMAFLTFSTVPEPSTIVLALFAGGAAAGLVVRRWRSKRAGQAANL